MPYQDCSIRPAQAGDLSALCGLLGELFAIESDFRVDPARQERGLKLLLADGRARVLAAEAAGRVVGMCTGQLVVSTAEGGPAVLVEDLVIQADWRGRGLGRGLLAALEDWARSRGAARLQLLADRDNRGALDFYRRLGWRQTRLVCLRRGGSQGERP